jgi:hypothetical protein
MSINSPEIRERSVLTERLWRTLSNLDLDGLRFLLLVAEIRTMTPEAVEELRKRILLSAPNKTELT